MEWLPWAPLGAAVVHISEEFVFPGGFAAWYCRYRRDPSRVTPKFLILVNAALIVAGINIAMLGRSTPGIAYWLTITALLSANGIWHLWATVKSHAYSPGVITGLLVYVPLTGYGYTVFLRSGEAAVGTAVAAAIVGGSYPFWSALYHGIRPRATGKQTAR